MKTKHTQLVSRFKKLFGCDTARITDPAGTLFLIIGHKKNTKDDAGEWYIYDNGCGEPIHFDYIKETCIASGKTMAELIASANEYKRLLNLKGNHEDTTHLHRMRQRVD